MENNQSAARAARRFLTERVRDDWDWPNTPECWSASDEEVRGVTEFRERYYGTTTPEPESAASSADPDPYKFDTPDSIGDAVELKNGARKRKRRVAQEDEMEWNEGLTCFVARRDAWTGAEAVKQHIAKTRLKDGPATTPNADSEDTLTNEPESSAINDAADPLIPLALPLLPDNPIRASIKPKTYTDIYNNIVVAGRSPSVPINLSDMTRALVHGWKESGEWPPKAAPLDPLAGRKRAAVGIGADEGQFLAHHPHMKRGMDSVKRIFHLSANHENGAS
ncbi:hypothetical protein K491DRAFT_712684 [Lophiostoma macrostomum CBS 122681]|uniref:Gag1-like clamp domain-containing protein n=1 Tax=Lophiostoma macrostomum CBS 122681 TaxID=1314788 RepID=A0A6A6TLE0_9PLEO|nr:hypothetical protein K491DRAFT_712684 [Lophiostoma macrostomum CBS 122681]